MNEKIYWLVPVFVLIIVLVLDFGFTQKTTELIQENPRGNVEGKIELIETKNVIDRSSYGIDKNVFELLPLPPQNFYEIKKLVENNQTTTSQITKEIYLQPEFVKNWFQSNCLVYYSENLNPVGFGFYPTKKRITLKAGEEFIEWFTVRNTCGSKHSYLMQLKLDSPKEIQAELNKTEFELQSTFPVFKDNWIQKIELKIKGNQKGTFIVVVNPVYSLIKIDDNWFELIVVVN